MSPSLCPQLETLKEKQNGFQLWGQRLNANELHDLLGLERESQELLEPTGPGAVLEIFPPLRYLPTKFAKRLLLARDGYHRWFPARNVEAKVTMRSVEALMRGRRKLQCNC